MGGCIDARLRELSIELPAPAHSVGKYAPYVRTGNQVWCVQGPLIGKELAYQGKVGERYTLEQAQACARLVCLNILTQVRAACDGDLDRVTRCVRLGGFINSAADFIDQTQVMNGASELILEIFGDKGRHARFAVGCNNLPYDLAVEIEGIFEIA
ncbi:MAG: RidA family protein [Gammaproteobacteria bacterium]|nr:RidA family protein [Gammaproteobacteria bacterium]